jgi:hypothetical protein
LFIRKAGYILLNARGCEDTSTPMKRGNAFAPAVGSFDTPGLLTYPAKVMTRPGGALPRGAFVALPSVYRSCEPPTVYASGLPYQQGNSGIALENVLLPVRDMRNGPLLLARAQGPQSGKICPQLSSFSSRMRSAASPGVSPRSARMNEKSSSSWCRVFSPSSLTASNTSFCICSFLVIT